MIRYQRWNTETAKTEETILGEGSTVAKFERYAGFDMYRLSAVYETEAGFVEVDYSGGYPEHLDYSRATVDATPEAIARYQADVLAKQAAAEAKDLERRRQERAREISRGAEIVVVRGRKVPVGTVGTCIWRGAGNYGERVGLKTEAGETFWTALANVEVSQGQIERRLAA